MEYLFSDDFHKRGFINPPTKINTKQIFISIASYRDTRTTDTIKSIFDTASNPNNIFIGICQQNAETDPDCMTNLPLHITEKIKIIRLLDTDARGPTWARWICSKLWQGEGYYLQIDSHMIFADNWDRDILKMYNKLPGKRNVISHYPPVSTTDKHSLKNTTVLTCFSHINNKGELIAKGKQVKATSTPQKTFYISACFIFARYNLILEIPFDPYLPFLFQGEEPLLGMRLYTSGWKIYNPSRCICTHYYDRPNDPKIWLDHNKTFYKWNKISKQRAYYFMGIQGTLDVEPIVFRNIETYGPGEIHSPHDWLTQIKKQFKK